MNLCLVCAREILSLSDNLNRSLSLTFGPEVDLNRGGFALMKWLIWRLMKKKFLCNSVDEQIKYDVTRSEEKNNVENVVERNYDRKEELQTVSYFILKIAAARMCLGQICLPSLSKSLFMSIALNIVCEMVID